MIVSMASNVCVDTRVLELLSRLGAKERKVLLKTLSEEQVRSVCECAFNLLRGNVPLRPHHKHRLGKFKEALRRLVKRGESLTNKRRYLVQKGGGAFLPLLLSAVLPLLLQKFTSG